MKIIKYLLFVLILLIPIITNAESVQTGKFSYMPAFSDKTEETYYYSDDYFRQSGKIDNEHLMTMSYNLALSTFEIRDYTYSKALLEELGFSDIKAEDMLEKPTMNTIGTVIAHKEIDGYNLVTVAIRGEKYDSEWGNNFIVGPSGDAKGFSDTSQKVLARVKKYIQVNNLENVKIWVAGYSRAGAVANLMGVYINNNPSEFNTTSDDMYIYTFETPKASTDKKIYDNIYVVVNKGDLVPQLYPESWGFQTNGKIIEIGDDDIIPTYKGLTEQEEIGEETINDYLKESLDWLTSRLDRETYASNLEKPISELLNIFFSKSNEDRQKVLNFFMEDVKTTVLDNQDVLFSKLWSVLGHNSDYLYEDITKTLIALIDEVKDSENGQSLTESEYNTFKKSLLPILRTLGPIIIDDANYYEGIDYDEYYSTMAEDYYITDEEMGKKYGTSYGSYDGYDAGWNGSEPNDYGEDEEYGPFYNKAYIQAYKEAYNKAYQLGEQHRNDLVARGKYDGAKYSYDTGYYDGSHQEECKPYDEYLWAEDWMTEEYINAYQEAYKEEYLKGYADGEQNPASEEEEEYHEALTLYHFMTLFKNIQTIQKNHHPQKNLIFIQDLDSYYDPYVIIDGEGQIVDITKDNVGNLIITANGDIEKLINVQVDNNNLTENECEVIDGSTKVILKDSYLKTLSEGTHKLKYVYIDDEIETEFTIKGQIQEINNPKTGDNILIYIRLLILSLIGLVITITYFNSKRIKVN